MNFCSPGFSFTKDNEDYNIVNCSSQCEIVQEEIADTSSPECSGKKEPLAPHRYSASNKRVAVKRKLLLQKPVLDIHLTNSSYLSLVRNEGHFQRSKRKKISTSGSNMSYDSNHVQDSAPDLENKLNDSEVKIEFCSPRDEIICSQESSGNISVVGEEQFSIKAFCETSAPIETDCEVKLEFCSPRDEIICSQESSSSINISLVGEEQFFIKELCETSAPTETDEKDMSDSDTLKEEIICSQDSMNKCQYAKKNDEFDYSSTPIKLRCNEDEKDNMSDSDTLKEEIISSQDSTNQFFQHSQKNNEFNDTPIKLLCSEDTKDHSDFDNSQEDIIYSQDSAGNISGIDSNLFPNTCGKPNTPLSPPTFSIEEEKRQEIIEFDGSAIDDGSEQDSQVTLGSSADALVIKINPEIADASSYSKENIPKCDDTIGSLICNEHVNQIELDEPNSEFFVKAPKKGTLLQRAYHIISDLKKEANLLSYEIKVGLRASKGAFVSEPLIIDNIYAEENNYIISCKPHEITKINNPCHVKESIYLFLSNLTVEMRMNSVIVIHFPLVALFGLPSLKVILFAENRIQVISSINIPTGTIDAIVPNSVIGPNDYKHMCVIKKKKSKTVINAIVDQLFGKFCSLELKLLRIFEQRTVTDTAVELLAADSENQFCLVKGIEYILLKDLNLEVSNLYLFWGFTLLCSKVKNEVKSAAEHYSSLKFCNDFIYTVTPCIDSWKIEHLSKTASNTTN